MAILRARDNRKRTRHFDLDAASRHGQSSRIALALAPERLVDTLMGAFFCALDVFILTVGVARNDAATVGGLSLLLLVTYVAVALYVSEHYHDLIVDRRRLIAVQGLTAGLFLLARIFLFFGWPIYLMPLGVFAIALSIAQGQRFSIAWTLLVAIILGFVIAEPGKRLPITAILSIGTIVGVLILGPRVSRRAKVIRAGIGSGIALVLLIFATEVLMRGRDVVADEVLRRPKDLLLLLGAGFLNGIFTGYFMVEFGLRAVEDVFDEVTDLRLMELADLNQPILKKFAIEAPGTFHHSQMVGTLAEAAAEAVGGNALLCRVGAHFHDIGKMVKPEYYIENMTSGAVTKHEGLTPRMSTMIIVSHVKDGIEMAEELGLPSCVIDFIPEHHGSIAVEYFYHQAVKQQEKEGGPVVSKDDFRYPGPMPQTRETAILMIADSVEAISRVLSEPNPSRIEQMVHDVVMRRLNEGQFDECAITLAELKRVEEAMCRVLMGVFHGRIKYPKAAGVDRPSQAEVNEALATAAQTPMVGAHGATPAGSTSGRMALPGSPAAAAGAPSGVAEGSQRATISAAHLSQGGTAGSASGEARRLERGDRVIVSPLPGPIPGLSAAALAGADARTSAEDTATRLRAAAIAADGPGTPARTLSDPTPAPLPAALAAAKAAAGKEDKKPGNGGQQGERPAQAIEPAHGPIEAATPTHDLRRPRSGGRF